MQHFLLKLICFRCFISFLAANVLAFIVALLLVLNKLYKNEQKTFFYTFIVTLYFKFEFKFTQAKNGYFNILKKKLNLSITQTFVKLKRLFYF